MRSKDYEDLLKGDSDALIARKAMLGGTFGNLDSKGISPKKKLHVHAVIVGIDSLTIAFVRQIALIAHYPNFNDETGENRTRITIIQEDVNTEEELRQCKKQVEEALGNLLSESICYLKGVNGTSVNREKSFIDIEFEIIGLHSQSYHDYLDNVFAPEENALITMIVRDGVIEKEQIKKFDKRFYQVCVIDERLSDISESERLINISKARKVNMIYQVGTYLSNVYVRDIADVKSYALALSTFAYHTPSTKVNNAWGRLKDETLKLSSVYCADTFPSRLRSIDDGRHKLQTLVENNIDALARTEHSRWNVERLILGYRPLTPEELYKDELLYDDDVTRYRKHLANQHIHINICSFKNLLRLDPESIKYDYFLMLAMTEIMK